MNIIWKFCCVLSFIIIILLMIHISDINHCLENLDRQLSDVVTYDTLKYYHKYKPDIKKLQTFRNKLQQRKIS